ncbi:MAG: Crp/Fnr family transcriptional regulator [Gracilibacteraceae bacterium]|jgi:CRP-like cAMP-binding protein|nr:Crp/Fnr family transcriptional regulator [Gracilibacteraceae bacterium]
MTEYTREFENLSAAGNPRNFQPGEILFRQGAENVGLYIVSQGVVRTFTMTRGGSELNSRIYSAPSIIGETSVIDNLPSVCTAMAMTALKTSVLDRRIAGQTIENTPAVMLALLHKYAALIRSFNFQLENITLTNRQKLARMLADSHILGLVFDGRSEIRVTHEMIANFLGATRSKVTEYLNQFEAQGLIVKSYGNIVVINRDGLRELYE